MKDMTTNSHSQEIQYHFILLRISSPNFNIKSDYISGNHEFAKLQCCLNMSIHNHFSRFCCMQYGKRSNNNICVTQVSYRILTPRHFYRKGCVKDLIHQIHMITWKNS